MGCGCGDDKSGVRGQAKPAPGPSICPPNGEAGDTVLEPIHTWAFFGNHFANLDFMNEYWPGGTESYVGYPVRLDAAAGFCRLWAVGGHKRVGEQTVTGVFPTEVSTGPRVKQAGETAEETAAQDVSI